MSVDLPLLKLTVTFGQRSRVLGRGGNSVAGDFRWSTIQPGGNNALQATIDYTEASSNASVYKYGAKVTLKLDSGSNSGQIVWQGYLRTVTRNADGTATLQALGFKQLLEERDDPLLWWTYDGWASAEDPPFDPYFNNADNIELNTGDRVKSFLVRKGDEIVTGDKARTCWWFQDHRVRYVAWTLAQNRVPTSGQWSLKLERFAGPTVGNAGAVVVQDVTLSAGAGSATISNANSRPMVAFRFTREGASVKDIPFAYRVVLKNLRVGDLAQADTYKSHQVAQDVGNLLKLDTSTMVNTGSNDAMPYWHQGGPWSQILNDMSDSEGGWKWAVWEYGTGGPKLEFRPWTSGTTWTINAFSSAANAVAQIEPSDDVYSSVRVLYRIAGQAALRSVTKATSASSLASLDPPRIRVLEKTLTQPQKDDTLATAVASRLASEWGSEQYTGTITLSYATSGTDKTAYLIQAGDQVTISDWPGGSSTFRIIETDCTETGVTLGIGRRSRFRHRRKHQDRHWAHHGIRWTPPAAP